MTTPCPCPCKNAQAGARVYNIEDLPVGDGVATALAFTAARYDIGGMFALANPTRLTIKRSGRYHVGGSVGWSETEDAGDHDLYVRLNGTTYIGTSCTVNSGAAVKQLVSTDYNLKKGDYLELVALQSTGGSIDVTAEGNYSPEFFADRIGSSS